MSGWWWIGLSGCAGRSSSVFPLDAEMQASLEASMHDVLAQTGAPGVALAVSDPSNALSWVGTAGLARIAGEVPWQDTSPYPIGSVTKTFTAAWVIQLADEGVLSLDDPLDAWVDTPWRGQGVTLTHLLQHTSGIASYNYVGDFDGSIEYAPTALVDWAALHEPALQFAPGTDFAYTNTGYVLLGMVGEAASGRALGDALDARFAQPLGLDATYLATSHPPDLVRGYRGEPLYDATDEGHPSAAWAAGGLISTPADLVAWGTALFSGQVVPADRLAQMTTPLILDGEEVGYGLGLFGGVDPDWGPSWGHTGGYSGQQTYLYYMEDPDRVVVAMVNSFEVDLDTVANAAWLPLLGLQ